MDGASGPVVDTQAPAVEEVRETPSGAEQGTGGQTSSPASTESTASPAAQSSAPTASEPDIESLLQNEDLVNKILGHQKVKQVIDHRVKSTRAADIANAVRDEIARRDAAKAAEDERQRLKTMEPYELGELVQKQLAESEQIAGISSKSYLQLAQATWRAIQNNPDLTDEEKWDLHPNNPNHPEYAQYDTWYETAYKASSRKEATKLAAVIRTQLEKEHKERVKEEAKAMVAQQLGQERENENGPANLPPAPPGLSDKDYMAAYARGDIDDHGRMAKQLKDWGLL